MPFFKFGAIFTFNEIFTDKRVVTSTIPRMRFGTSHSYYHNVFYSSILKVNCKLVVGVLFKETCELDGASTRNFLVKKYPCSIKSMPKKEFVTYLLCDIIKADDKRGKTA